ncbi:hypothetical protein ACIRVF_22350 [Kitasatospora sp. NPDC101157]|uniref:hypothetical protein n=1 Tax=Kitasatospora sp. NPDC101157 TaxID=3364098 RepID=UPI0037FEFC68
MNRIRAIAAVVGVAATLALSAGPAQASAQSTSGYIHGSDVIVGSCKAWMNERGSGSSYETQGLVQSWGDYCRMELARSDDGGSTWHPVSNPYWVRNQAKETGFHWDPPGHLTEVCLYDAVTRVGACSNSY